METDSGDSTMIHHLIGGTLHAPPNPRAGCHCLVLQHGGKLALVDTGIGLRDVAEPEKRIGEETIRLEGFQFHEEETILRQLERQGFRADDVTDIVLTHADPDHTGGLADFPEARVHLSREEHVSLARGRVRYAPAHFDHGPSWQLHGPSRERWLGLEARSIALGNGVDVLLVPLFGHTLGHCGVAVREGERWLLHVGDAYYLRVELDRDDHPVGQLAALRADDDARRRASLAQLRRLARDHAGEVDCCGYHDLDELARWSSPWRTTTSV
ncbi:Metallo-beta-lactamase superfamily protein [Planctomycetes bacterium Pan216]|uniref:Metallo-beta-lactamase superfamily protein n=1 Tax=Kolteria novifilia TaxID=2527975 RepID=A0A518B3X1_9BACT|nr:Metallo-beta-lactamase superfamily protein [Planctomycetes bacterium Pan216]